jgi:hypothetical protein
MRTCTPRLLIRCPRANRWLASSKQGHRSRASVSVQNKLGQFEFPDYAEVGVQKWLRASSLVSLTRPRYPFFHPGGKKRLSRASDFSISPGFEPLSIRRAQAIPGFPRRARGLRTKEIRAKRRGNFPRVVWPRLVGERGRSSSSSHRLPRIVVFPRIVFRVL